MSEDLERTGIRQPKGRVEPYFLHGAEQEGRGERHRDHQEPSGRRDLDEVVGHAGDQQHRDAGARQPDANGNSFSRPPTHSPAKNKAVGGRDGE
ncbi:MAG: hypothetical protein ACKVZ0_03210 [Gemmatimonadales bacterium]